MLVATDSTHRSIFAVVARRKGGQDDHVMQSFQNYIDRWGSVKAELKCDQEPSILQTVPIHDSGRDCNANWLERELGAWTMCKCRDGCEYFRKPSH